MKEQGDAYDVLVKRVRDNAIEKIVRTKREEHAKQSSTAGHTCLCLCVVYVFFLYKLSPLPHCMRECCHILRVIRLIHTSPSPPRPPFPPPFTHVAYPMTSRRLMKIMEQLKTQARDTIKSTPGKKNVDASIFLHCGGVVLDAGIAKGKEFGRDSRVRASFLELCRGKPSAISTLISPTPTVMPQIDETLWNRDKTGKQQYMREALKRKMQLSAHMFSWNPKDWTISGWPADVRPLMDPSHYKVSELRTLYASLSRITFISAVPVSKEFAVALSAQEALSSLIDSCDMQLARTPASEVSSSSSSSSSQLTTHDQHKLDLERLKLISAHIPSLMGLTLAELQSKLSPF